MKAQQFHDPADQSGVILAFRRARCPFSVLHAKPQGFDAEAEYEFTDEDSGRVFTVKGSRLLENGLDLTLNEPRSSLLLRYKKL